MDSFKFLEAPLRYEKGYLMVKSVTCPDHSLMRKHWRTYTRYIYSEHVCIEIFKTTTSLLYVLLRCLLQQQQRFMFNIKT